MIYINPKTAARNIIKKYQPNGAHKFQLLIEMFCNKESGEKIAFAFNVTRQRVHQWRKLFGTENYTYIPHNSIMEFLDKKTFVIKGSGRTEI